MPKQPENNHTNNNINKINEFQQKQDNSQQQNNHQQLKYQMNQSIHNSDKSDNEPYLRLQKSNNNGGYHKKSDEIDNIKDKKNVNSKESIDNQLKNNGFNHNYNSINSNINNNQDGQNIKKEQNNNHNHNHNKVGSQIHRLSLEQRQQFANFRMKRDLWLRDLQEVFNKIYDNFVQTLQTLKENSTISQTKKEKLQFRKQLRNQIKELKKIALNLSDKDDEFIHLQENIPMTYFYRNNIMEMHQLLSILLKLQMDNKTLDKIKTSKRNNNKCSIPLLQEIKRSYRRVQRLKAGNKLGQVISDQLQEKDIADVLKQQEQQMLLEKQQQLQLELDSEQDKFKNNNNNIVIQSNIKIPSKQTVVFKIENNNNNNSHSQFPKIQSSNLLNELQQLQQPQSENKLLFKNNYNSDHKNYNSNQKIIEHQSKESDDDEYDPYFLENDNDDANEEYLKNNKYFNSNKQIDLDFAIKDFQKKKENLSQMISKFVENVDKKDFNFNEKYLNFKEYFAKRYELMSMYLGDNKLNYFLEENERNMSMPQKMNMNELYDNDYDNLYKDLDPTNFQVDDKNIEAIQRIIKINEEIRKNLIEEEHQNKVKVLDQMNVEQNQQFWTQVFEKRSAQNNNNNNNNNGSNNNNQSSKIKKQMNHSHSVNSITSRKLKSTDHDLNQYDSNNRKHQINNSSNNYDDSDYQNQKTKNEQKKEQLKLYHDYIHRNVNYNAHPSNPNLKHVLSNQSNNNTIKFTSVSENQPIHIVSSLISVQKEINEKKRGILNKQPYQKQIKDNEDFKRTFHMSTFYSSGRIPIQLNTIKSGITNTANQSPQSQQQIGQFLFDEIKIKYPQKDQDDENQMIKPNKGKQLSYEEEMKLISNQTKKDNPLYINKFNARNYLTRVQPMSQKSSRNNNSNNKFHQTTTNQFFSNNNKLQSNNNNNNIKVELNISNPLSRQLQQPFSNVNGEKQIIDKKENQDNLKLDDINHKLLSKPKDYYKDEISSLFRVSQRDLLFKINGPSWKISTNAS